MPIKDSTALGKSIKQSFPNKAKALKANAISAKNKLAIFIFYYLTITFFVIPSPIFIILKPF